MAVDTRDKRSSAINLSNPWRGMLPTPGTITQPDRQHVPYMYSGIAATSGGGGAVFIRENPMIASMGRMMNR